MQRNALSDDVLNSWLILCSGATCGMDCQLECADQAAVRVGCSLLPTARSVAGTFTGYGVPDGPAVPQNEHQPPPACFTAGADKASHRSADPSPAASVILRWIMRYLLPCLHPCHVVGLHDTIRAAAVTKSFLKAWLVLICTRNQILPHLQC